MNTEITDNEKLNGWVLYDADCPFCTRLARFFRTVLARRKFEVLPLQTPWVRAKLGLADSELLAEMRLLKPGGDTSGGADALLEISRYFWWTWPLRSISRIPTAMNLVRTAYRWMASHRGCAKNACKFRPVTAAGTVPLTDLLPLVALPCLAFASRTRLAPWVFMWTMAFALYFGCKWMTYRRAIRSGLTPSRARTWGYLLLWPGMDAAGFLDKEKRPARPAGPEWLFAAVKTIAGSLLLWVIVRLVLPAHPLLAGWIGMGGIILILHFGLFHLLSLIWRQAGAAAMPVMDNPLLAKSLTEFWGRRWNTAFNELAFHFTYRPLRRVTNPMAATLLVFCLSGLIHELVISVPAHGGYGLPTLFFLVQGVGIAGERSRDGRRVGLGHGIRGWLFTLMVTAGPAFWLLHPPFIKNVILPMLTAIGAT